MSHAKKQLSSGKIGVSGDATSEPIKSDLSGETIRRHVTLPTGAKIHPDELHRIQHDENGQHHLGPENVGMRDPMASNGAHETHPTFERALRSATAIQGRDDDRVTIQGPHGYSAEKTRGEWRPIHAGVKEKPESFASWYDRENPPAVSGAATNSGPKVAKPATEGETRDYFAPPEHQGKLFDYKTQAHGDIFALPSDVKKR